MPRTAYGRAADDIHAGSLSVDLPEWVSQMPLAAAGSQELHGTVPATLEETDIESYASSSEALIWGQPVHRAPAAAKPPQKVSAKDLVAELDSINSQIHRIMFQVERAVARLATSG